MRKNDHFMVAQDAFRLLTAWSELSEYRFGTKTARHLFCKTCGIASFYAPRSNPGSYGITAHCVDPGTLDSVEICDFDGLNWEASYAATGISSEGGG